MTILEKALCKRERIICREGDLDGYRLTQEYLNKLCEEQLTDCEVVKVFGIRTALPLEKSAS
jgi:hypothetical protein